LVGRLSLRARLVLGVIALAAIGLAVADVATYASLRSFLVDRMDKTLEDGHFGVERSFEHGCSEGGPPTPPSAGDYVQLRTAAGTVLCSQRTRGFPGQAYSPPSLPATITVPARGHGAESARYFTVSAQDGGQRYRVRASRERDGDMIIVTAMSLSGVDATLHRLLWIALVVTGAVLAALAGLGLWVVRLGLRPLDAIGATAAAIAAGDLTRRVARAEPRTEVGRLGLALNSMLGQIEAAFTATAASEQRLRRFVADASHELRTPLAAVRAYAELFARGADRRPEDLARSMAGITRESERMSLLVDDLLLLARLDEGRPLHRELVDLTEIVGDSVETASTVDPDRPIAFEAEAAPVYGDREQLRQIVDNLLANVRAHTPPRAAATVSVRRAESEVVVEVTDSGPGMTSEQAERAFERFYRADPARARARGGVGLGLSIVVAVATAHGGTAAARSEPGRGTTFRITLPLADRSGAASRGEHALAHTKS
jgi:two-component system, OmpR family, sensor kinase